MICIRPHTCSHRYEGDAQRRERFFYEMLRGSGPPPDKCTPEIIRIVIQQHLCSPSCWAIFPMQVHIVGV